jgi:hypothetical protein
MPLPALLTPSPPADQPPTWHLSLGLQVAPISAVAPGLIPGVAAFIDVQRTDASVFSPSLRASAFVAWSGLIRSGAVYSKYYWIAGRLEGCPLRLRPLAWLKLSPCALLDAGVLDAEGGGRATSASRVRPWIAPGILGRIQAEISEPLFLEVEAGAIFPLVRDTFYVAPMIDVHRVPAVGASLAAGVGFHFF